MRGRTNLCLALESPVSIASLSEQKQRQNPGMACKSAPTMTRMMQDRDVKKRAALAAIMSKRWTAPGRYHHSGLIGQENPVA